MSLLHRLHGARWCALRQQRRRHNGIRGIFAGAALDRGELVLSVPLRYCFITQLDFPRDGERSLSSVLESVKGLRYLRRCNRGVALFPEAWIWLQRFSADAPADRVSLNSTISCEAAQGSSAAVMSLSLSPVEAALATCVALRYFYSHALHLPPSTRVTQSIGPAPHDLSDRFTASLPFEDYLRWGLESLYSDVSCAEAHLCLEQLSSNLRDAIMTHANNMEFRFIDEAPSLFETVLLTSLYLVRSRVLQVPLLSSTVHKLNSTCAVFAPGLDALNHCSTSPAAAVVVSALRRSVVVRAMRRIRRGEEITIDYRQSGLTKGLSPGHLPYKDTLCSRDVICMNDDWSTRYLMDMPC
ncbi:hypothetical protein, conserved [Leishmania tarentolae]|uniref:SET domain-containing protein n=1 Tax=Leishmania tarentolae TaxID=5689 RepID=A0A640KTH2_LEITA|nr:hypothetical protein, conserved [Leishmania tarentolae]